MRCSSGQEDVQSDPHASPLGRAPICAVEHRRGRRTHAARAAEPRRRRGAAARVSQARVVWEQAGGIVGAFVASQGSGGTLTGVGRYLRERDGAVRLYAVEPDECALLSRRAWGPHGIEGIGDGFISDNLDVSMLTGVITTTTDQALTAARRLAAEEGIFCGISTGCNVAAALKLAARHPDLPSIVTMANDTGQRYFTTALCGEVKHVDVPERAHPMDDQTRRELDRWQSKWEILR